MIRMSPVLPGPVLNYALGVSKLSLRHYLVASLGTVPVIVTYAFIGSTLTRISNAALEESLSLESDPALLILGLGLAATVFVTWLLARRTRKVLAQRESTQPA